MKAAAFVLSVLTLNIAGPRRVQQGWQSRLAEISRSLKAERSDAAAFQEAWRSEDVDALASAAGHPHRVHEPALGLAITSRNAVVDRAALDLGGGHGVLRAGLVVDGAVADVYSARFRPGSGPAASLRLGQFLRAAEFVRAQSKDRPVVLLGDFGTSADDSDARLFLDFLGARDLCVSHGDEMCGRTLEDRRVDYAVIPYSSRPPRETARAAFTQAREDESPGAAPGASHFGLGSRLDAVWLKLRLAPEPDGRAEALTSAADHLNAARDEAESRVDFSAWIPWRGTVLAERARAAAARLAADGEFARSALARAAVKNSTNL